jgi:hypothetical protein
MITNIIIELIHGYLEILKKILEMVLKYLHIFVNIFIKNTITHVRFVIGIQLILIQEIFH